MRRPPFPTAIVARLNREIVEILKEPDTIETLDKLGVEVADPGTPEALGRRIGADIVKWRDVIKDTQSHP